MLVTLWLLILCYSPEFVSSYEEIVETRGCHACKLSLTCRHLTAVIAILKVDFDPDANNRIFQADFDFANSSTARGDAIVPPFPPVHPRDALNRRCSGLNHCSFILSEECPGSEFFGAGNITVQYACITDDRIHKYCNDVILAEDLASAGLAEGYIRNPGYPRFYSGELECKWRIIGRANQRIRITLLDVALIVENSGCDDVLEIRDTGQVIFSTCEQDHPPSEVLSGGPEVEIALRSGQRINPRRGFLAHFKIVGCPEFEVPNDAYLVHRTNRILVFSCCLGYAFPETGARITSVVCQGAFWNASADTLTCTKTGSLDDNRTAAIEIFQSKIKTMNSKVGDNIVAPLVVLVVLFVVNSMVLFVIYIFRKRQELKDVKDEELGPIANPSQEQT
ncbi:unnamed protein product [Phyllotreta striolata]|uniref:CUB domain-containing protein n=1 Tax=Phyllotreta striolata TaxID=444603 RepID=A0A9N9XTD6_PHYSR|nr:unnamed protein product [Phyllotreta striolata]